jgi:hypothetical protein
MRRDRRAALGAERNMPRLFLVVVGAPAIRAGVGMSAFWNGHGGGSVVSAFLKSRKRWALVEGVSRRRCQIGDKHNIVKGMFYYVNGPVSCTRHSPMLSQLVWLVRIRPKSFLGLANIENSRVFWGFRDQDGPRTDPEGTQDEPRTDLKRSEMRPESIQEHHLRVVYTPIASERGPTLHSGRVGTTKYTNDTKERRSHG